MEVPGSIFRMGFSLMKERKKEKSSRKMFASFLSCTQMVRPRCLKATVHFNVDFAKHNIVNSKTDKDVLME